jgi:hypothetical protein
MMACSSLAGELAEAPAVSGQASFVPATFGLLIALEIPSLPARAAVIDAL